MNRDCKKEAGYNTSYHKKYADGGSVKIGNPASHGIVADALTKRRERMDAAIDDKPQPKIERADFKKSDPPKEAGSQTIWGRIQKAVGFADGGMVASKVAPAPAPAKPKSAPPKPAPKPAKPMPTPQRYANGGKVKKFADGGIEGESSSKWVQEEQAKLKNRLDTAADPRNDEPAYHASVPASAAEPMPAHDMPPAPVSAAAYPDRGEDALPSQNIVGNYVEPTTPAAKLGAAAGTKAAVIDKSNLDQNDRKIQGQKLMQGVAHLAGTMGHARGRAAAVGRGDDPNAVVSDIPPLPKSGLSTTPKAKTLTKADRDWESMKSVASKLGTLTDLRPAGAAIAGAVTGAGRAIRTGTAKLANKSMGRKVYDEGEEEKS